MKVKFGIILTTLLIILSFIATSAEAQHSGWTGGNISNGQVIYYKAGTNFSKTLPSHNTENIPFANPTYALKITIGSTTTTVGGSGSASTLHLAVAGKALNANPISSTSASATLTWTASWSQNMGTATETITFTIHTIAVTFKSDGTISANEEIFKDAGDSFESKTLPTAAYSGSITSGVSSSYTYFLNAVPTDMLGLSYTRSSRTLSGTLKSSGGKADFTYTCNWRWTKTGQTPITGTATMKFKVIAFKMSLNANSLFSNDTTIKRIVGDGFKGTLPAATITPNGLGGTIAYALTGDTLGLTKSAAKPPRLSGTLQSTTGSTEFTYTATWTQGSGDSVRTKNTAIKFTISLEELIVIEIECKEGYPIENQFTPFEFIAGATYFVKDPPIIDETSHYPGVNFELYNIISGERNPNNLFETVNQREKTRNIHVFYLQVENPNLKLQAMPLVRFSGTKYIIKSTEDEGTPDEITRSQVAFQLNVSANDPPVFSNGADIEYVGEVGKRVNINFPKATDAESQLPYEHEYYYSLNYTFTDESDLPEGLHYYPSFLGIGDVPGVPVEPQERTMYTWEAKDNWIGIAKINVYITINPASNPVNPVRPPIIDPNPPIVTNNPPTFNNQSIANIRATVNLAIQTVTLPQATDPENDAITYTLTGLPNGLRFNASNRQLSGTPTTAQSASVYTYTATDTEGNKTELTFTITVNASSPPPVITNNPPTFNNQSIANIIATVNLAIQTITLPQATDPENDAITYTLSTLPNGLQFNPSNRQLSGTPTTASSVSVYTYTATDTEGNKAELTFTIIVNDPPSVEPIDTETEPDPVVPDPEPDPVIPDPEPVDPYSQDHMEYIAVKGMLNHIVISEIMFESKGNLHSLPQWMELYNTTDMDINIREWKLQWYRHEPKLLYTTTAFATDFIIPARSARIICSTPSRNSGHYELDNSAVYSLLSYHSFTLDQSDGRNRNRLIARGGFYIRLTDSVNTLIDDIGTQDHNAAIRAHRGRKVSDPVWELPNCLIDNRMRTSLIRRFIDPTTPRAGTERKGWIRQYDTRNRSTERWYGRRSDFGTLGYKSFNAPLPVTLSAFEARYIQGNVTIQWKTESEIDNAGFNILRSQSKSGSFVKVNTSMILGAGTTGESQEYVFADTTAKHNVEYYYQIEDISFDGDIKLLSTTKLKGFISANNKLTSTWGSIKVDQDLRSFEDY